MLGQEVSRQDGRGRGLGLLRRQRPALRPLQVIVQPTPPQQPSSAPRAREECGEAHPPLDLVDSVSVEMNEDRVILAFVVDVATCFMVGDCCSQEAAFGDLLMTATTGRTRCWRQSGCDPASMSCSASIIQHILFI
ncbi:hypothetical protein PVAP13_7KG210610 [Panicum virgatum]|uniref:Uncharacterized protein n=1 Tax=Panicum virgatum TaxID=38727 RepID=A0A8T0QGR6_PANVG|nr:hypothetical protein PVAP13_7KG210610 [Panicum virgatum]